MFTFPFFSIFGLKCWFKNMQSSFLILETAVGKTTSPSETLHVSPAVCLGSKFRASCCHTQQRYICVGVCNKLSGWSRNNSLPSRRAVPMVSRSSLCRVSTLIDSYVPVSFEVILCMCTVYCKEAEMWLSFGVFP